MMQNSNALHLLGIPVSQIPTISLTLNIALGLRGDLLVNVHTSVCAYGEWSNSPCIGHASFGVKVKSNTPPFPLHSPGGGGGVVGHNINRCFIIIVNIYQLSPTGICFHV